MAVKGGLAGMLALAGHKLFAQEKGAKEKALPSYPAGMSDAEIDAVFARAKADLEAKSAFLQRLINQPGSNWDVDLDAGTITFVDGKGTKAVAPVQVVGTWSTVDGTLLWGWDHPSVPPPLAVHAGLVRKFGQDQGLAALTTRKIEASEDDCWRYTALAQYLAGANGAYRGPTGRALVYMTFGELTLSKA